MFTDSEMERLGHQLAEGADGTFRVASVPTSTEPLDLVRAAADRFEFSAYFALPGVDEFGGAGVAWRSESGPGPDRYEEISRALAGSGIDARAFTGFAYDPDGGASAEWDGFSSASVVIPLVSIVKNGGKELVVVLPPDHSWASVEPMLRGLVSPAAPATGRTTDLSIESRPAPSRWEEAVANAVQSIKGGDVDKVVLARSVMVTSDEPYLAFDLVARLRSAYPACYIFGWQVGEAVFVGASPELLSERSGMDVRSHPLAGSAARGLSEEEDRAFGELLMASSKDRHEHRFVVTDIADRFGTIAHNISVDAVPSLRKTTHVQHLSTEIQATLAEPLSVIEIAGHLHPTPAVGGSPRAESAIVLGKEESIDRGWYAGGIGWVHPDGTGSIAIALRCALVRSTTAWLYAGAGIVSDSDPSAELEETRLKFRTMMSLLAEA